jgi:tricorn protease
MTKNILLFVIYALYFVPTFSQGTLLLRQPTISKFEIVFVYADDLWKVSIAGGDAIRLTSDEGTESFPHFSHDEKWIAFSAQYDGNTDVYVIPSQGGEPKRLTYHPSPDVVTGWTPDGEVLFRSSRKGHPTQTNKFYTIGMEEGLPTEFKIPRAAYGEISPDGKHIAYVPITSWDPEWRNYRGGQAMPIWIVDLKTNKLIRTPQLDKERHQDPVWFDNKVYYLSERDFANNIWSFDPRTKKETQITFHDQFDVKSLDASADKIIYEQGGRLHLLDPEIKKAATLTIHVKGDMNFSRPRWEDVSSGSLQNPNLSPSAKRAIFEHRGEIFTFPKEDGSWYNLTNSPGTADRSPVWSPDGDKVAWFSDGSGEYKLVLADQYGVVEKTYDLKNPTFYFKPEWSPDGKKIAYTDTDFNLWLLDLDSGELIMVDTDRYAHPNRSLNPQWSPDSKWVAYAKQQDSHFKAAFVYSLESGAATRISDPYADVITPVWDESGKYIFILASTDYGLNSGWLDMSSYDPRVNRSLYAIVLSKETIAPTLPKSDDEEIKEIEEDAKDTKESKNKEEENGDSLVVVDLEGITDRTVPLDMGSGNFTGLIKGAENHVLILKSVDGQNGQQLWDYDLTKRKSTELTSGVNAIVSSIDGKNMLIGKEGNWIIGSSTSPIKGNDGALFINAKVKVDPKSEYKQIFKEGWRYMRDFLYVDNVHGAPWKKVYDWYAPWIDHVSHRSDLNYVVDILSGEVAVGHSFVNGGDLPDLDFVPIGLLGCDLSKDGEYYRIDKIYSGESWNPSTIGPLSLPGLDINEGDILLEINGQALTTKANPYRLLEHTAGRNIRIKIGNKNDPANTKVLLVSPVRSESQLRTFDWIENNRKTVEEMSGGKLAYVYVPNTGGQGFEYFNRYYFSQQDKKGVIVDERNNGGGSAADYMIDIMNRKLFGFFNSRAGDNRPWTTPMAGIWGPKVMIVNERAGSGGDLLPYMFHAAEIGPLVGTRTWGGLVGTWDTPSFIDGGRMVAPRGGFFDVDGNWAVEGDGIEPDIEVIQEPGLVINGADPQLEAALKEAMRLLKGNEFMLKPEPPAPIRWKRPDSFKKK